MGYQTLVVTLSVIHSDNRGVTGSHPARAAWNLVPTRQIAQSTEHFCVYHAQKEYYHKSNYIDTTRKQTEPESGFPKSSQSFHCNIQNLRRLVCKTRRLGFKSQSRSRFLLSVNLAGIGTDSVVYTPTQLLFPLKANFTSKPT